MLGIIADDSSDEERETDHYTCMGIEEDVDTATDCGVLEDVFVTENNEQIVYQMKRRD